MRPESETPQKKTGSKPKANKKKGRHKKRSNATQAILLAVIAILVLLIVSMGILLLVRRNMNLRSASHRAAAGLYEDSTFGSVIPSALTESAEGPELMLEPEEASAEEPLADSAAEDAQSASTAAEADPTPKGKNASVTISFAGDCTFASYYGATYTRTFENYYEEFGESYFFQNVREYFQKDDLTVVNLEGTFTTSTERVRKTFNFKSDPSYVGILHDADIECVNVANNHTHDYSESGYEETIQTLDDAGISWFGGEDTCLLEVNGVLLGFSGIYECESGLACKDQAVANVEALKEAGAEVIICEFHWGEENSYAPNSKAVTLAHAVIDAGADLVIGHHPHVLQGIELYKGKYICYSLGNFCFGGNPGGKDKNTMIYQTTFEIVDGTLQDRASYTIIPCSTSTESSKNTYCPTPADGEQAEAIMQKIYKLCGYLDGGITADDEAGGVIINEDHDDSLRPIS